MENVELIVIVIVQDAEVNSDIQPYNITILLIK
jgi:hypothetical protein